MIAQLSYIVQDLPPLICISHDSICMRDTDNKVCVHNYDTIGERFHLGSTRWHNITRACDLGIRWMPTLQAAGNSMNTMLGRLCCIYAMSSSIIALPLWESVQDNIHGWNFLFDGLMTLLFFFSFRLCFSRLSQMFIFQPRFYTCNFPEALFYICRLRTHFPKQLKSLLQICIAVFVTSDTWRVVVGQVDVASV